MPYDPFLRKDVYADKLWYDEFSIFFAIGVCQAEEKDVSEIREALARFLCATRTIPYVDKPGTVLIAGDGAIDADQMETYIKRIRSESHGINQC